MARPSPWGRKARQANISLSSIDVRMETIGELYTTIMVLINEDSLATVERQLDTQDHLIA
jgi:hypothetical protein